MIIRELQLENFRCFEDQHFEFPDGVIGILGPNGSGKSTILEALSWALYGSSALRTTRDDLRLDSASDSGTCRVSLKFRLDGEDYELERKMTGKTLSPRAYIKNSGETLAESFQGVTQYVEEELLKMKESSFFRSVFSKQNEVRELSSGGPEDRRQLFASLLDIDKIKAARRVVDADARKQRQRAEALAEQLGNLEEMEMILQDKESQKKELSERVTSLEESLSELNDEITSKEDKFQDLEESKDKLNDLEKTRENLRARIESYKDNINEREDELEQLNRKEEEAEELKDLADRYEKLEQQKSELEEKKDLYRDKEELKSRVGSKEDDINKEREKLNQKEKKLQNLSEVSEKLKKKKLEKKQKDEEITELKARVAEIESSIDKLREDLGELNEKEENVEELGTEGKCPVCNRPLGDDYGTVINHYREDIERTKEAVNGLKEEKTEVLEELEKAKAEREKLEKAINDLEAKEQKRTSLVDRIEDLRTRVEELEEVREDLKEELKDFGKIDFDEEKHRKVNRELDSLKEDYERYKSLLAETKRVSKVEDKLEEFRDELKKTEAELQEVEGRIEGIEFDEERFNELKKELKELRKEKDAIKDDYAEKSEKLAKLKTEINHLAGDIDHEKEKREKLNRLKEDRLLLERVSSYFDQFRLDLLNRIRPHLSRRASSLLERTTDGRYRKLTIDDNYLVRVHEDGTPYPLDRFSGGETDLANLCLRVAISELVAQRSGKPINFIVLDEIFGSQDQQRRHNILRALRNLDDLFVQIFLITHSEEVKDRLENVLLLSRESHGTTTVQKL